jgi:Uncharacterized protein conserved in bacteria
MDENGTVDENRIDDGTAEKTDSLVKEVSDGTVYVDEKAFSELNSKKKRKKKALIITLSVIVILLAAGYFSMVYYASSRYNPGTVIDGHDMSFKTVDEAESIVGQKYKGYELKIIYRDGEEIIKADDIDLKVDVRTSLEKIKEQQSPYEWFRFDRKTEDGADWVLNYNEQLLEMKLGHHPELDTANMKKPENPEIVYEDGRYHAEPGDQGNTIDLNKYNDLLRKHLRAMDREFDVDAEGCYEEAWLKVDSGTVTKCVDKVNGMLSGEVSYLYGETEVPVITKDDIADMIRIDKAYRVTLDKNMLTVKFETFANEHDTFYQERQFRTHDGKIVTIPPSYYGWEINREGEVEQLYTDICSKKKVVREPDFNSWEYVYNISEYGVDDVGNSYAEVDLTNQMVYLFIDGEQILSSPCVTGNVSAGMSTPEGLYEILTHSTDTELTGGEEPVMVDYWMRFVRGIGFHDASWRWEFGGDIYYYNGSHGCVNLPYSAAQTMFYYTYIGMPVIVYWR